MSPGVNLAARAAAAEAQRARTRERLLEAAVKVIVEKGSEAATIEDFVAAAGVARGTFYNYFPTANDLIHALHRHVISAAYAGLEALDRQVDSPALRLAVSGHYLLWRGEIDTASGWIMLRLSDFRAPREPRLEARFEANLREAVARGELAPHNAAAARALAFGGIRMAQQDILSGAAPDGHAHKVVSLIMQALGAPADRAEAMSADALLLVRGPGEQPS